MGKQHNEFLVEMVQALAHHYCGENAPQQVLDGFTTHLLNNEDNPEANQK